MRFLRYLNLAVNNITAIEGTEGCESLTKLDLTVNFVDDLSCIRNLTLNHNLRELFLTGNPCTSKPYYREYIVGTLPQLIRLDGTEITRSERIIAMQKLEENEALVRAASAVIRAEEERKRAGEGEPKEQRYNEKGEPVYGNTPEDRVRLHKELMARKEASDPNADAKKKPPKPKPSVQVPDTDRAGRILNRNEGKLPFEIDYSPDGTHLVMELGVGKFLDTSLLDADVQPTYVRVVAKDKVFQFVLPDEVHPDQSKCERNITTGKLVITCKMVKDVPLTVVRMGKEDPRKSKPQQAKDRAAQEQKERAESEGLGGDGNDGSGDGSASGKGSLLDKDIGKSVSLDYRNIVPKEGVTLEPLPSRIVPSALDIKRNANINPHTQIYMRLGNSPQSTLFFFHSFFRLSGISRRPNPRPISSTILT